jgi:NitT/TauT family transport system substrate-binding protein
MRTSLRKRWRAVIPAAVLALTAMSVAACGQDDPQPSGEGETIHITFTMASASLSNQTVFTADEMGIFARNGLTVDIVTTGSAAQSMATLLSGDAQFSLGSRDDAITAKLQGRDVIYVGKHQAGWRAGIVISTKLVPDAKVLEGMSLDEKLKLLDGKRFASPSASSALTNLSKAAFEKAGVEVEFVYLEAPVVPTALANGDIDGFIQGSPTLDQAVLNGAGVVLVKGTDVPGSGGPTGLWAPLLATGSWVKANPEATTKVLASFFEAARWTKENPEKAKEITRNRLNLAPEVFEAAWANNVDGLISPFDSPLSAADIQVVLEADFPPETAAQVSVADVLIDEALIAAAHQEAAAVTWLSELTPKS